MVSHSLQRRPGRARYEQALSIAQASGTMIDAAVLIPERLSEIATRMWLVTSYADKHLMDENDTWLRPHFYPEALTTLRAELEKDDPGAMQGEGITRSAVLLSQVQKFGAEWRAEVEIRKRRGTQVEAARKVAITFGAVTIPPDTTERGLWNPSGTYVQTMTISPLKE